VDIYHKIQSVFKRDPENQHKTFLDGQYSRPEFEYLKDNEWVFTEKVDGTNIRIGWDGIDVKFGGRSDNAQLHTDLMLRLYKLFPKDRFLEFGNDITLYGEGYGAGIQKGGGNYQDKKDFVLFDVKIGGYWLQREDAEEIANTFNIKIVPVIGKGTLEKMISITKTNLVSEWGNFQAEGIVAKPSTELVSRNGQRIITKIKCKDFPRDVDKLQEKT